MRVSSRIANGRQALRNIIGKTGAFVAFPYPLPGSMAPQGALYPELTRLTGGCPCQIPAVVDTGSI